MSLIYLCQKELPPSSETPRETLKLTTHTSRYTVNIVDLFYKLILPFASTLSIRIILINLVIVFIIAVELNVKVTRC